MPVAPKFSSNGSGLPEHVPKDPLPKFDNPDALKYWRVFEKRYGECLFFSREMDPHLAPQYRYKGGGKLKAALINEWKEAGIAIVINASKRKDQERFKIRFIKRPPDDPGIETLKTTITDSTGREVDPLDSIQLFTSLFHKPTRGTKASLYMDWRGCCVAIHPRPTKTGHWWSLAYKAGDLRQRSKIGFPTEQEAIADVLKAVRAALE